ncbi:hypothetical protein G7Z17_g12973 [Cylindrodendrum hubeiense]|uniref:Uncharacterized protein n=1 Tax=Cylindrodendrum hubeiense TaxID=595255 RepID=A0A9P5H1Y2_9HYPO|nr:hypothetical protein G7Z17_g12973 [Cylindrodendrum hubeiense]
MRVSAGAQQISSERQAVSSRKPALGDASNEGPGGEGRKTSTPTEADCRDGGRWLAGGQMASKSGYENQEAKTAQTHVQLSRGRLKPD